MRAAIVGSGIAGLAAAIVLRRHGAEVLLLERAGAPLAVGSGLLLQPPGLAALARLGLLEDALARGARIAKLDGRARTGRRVLHLEYSNWSPGSFGLGMHRGALWHLLFERARADGVEVRAGCDVVALEQQAASCSLLQADGTRTGPFDFALFACGSRTTLRGKLGLEDGTRPYAWGAFYATVPMPSGWTGDTLAQRFDGTARMMGILPIGLDSSGAGPWLTLFWSERLDRMEAVRAEGWAAWRGEALRLWPEARPLLDSLAGFGDLTVAAYADVRVRPWVIGRGAVIGDMAHGTSPQLGQGATLALLDAEALGASLQATASVQDALVAYARARRSHVAYYQWASRILTPFFQSETPGLGALRDAFMGPVGGLPIVRREFLATLTGHKTGIVFGRLPS